MTYRLWTQIDTWPNLKLYSYMTYPNVLYVTHRRYLGVQSFAVTSGACKAPSYIRTEEFAVLVRLSKHRMTVATSVINNGTMTIGDECLGLGVAINLVPSDRSKTSPSFLLHQFSAS